MQITITSNIAEVAAQMGATAANIERAIQAGIKAATELVALPLSKARLEVIYHQPIPTLKNGKAAWVRTGNLRDAEEAAFPRADMGVIQTNESSPAFAYSEPRHELQSRPNPWRDEARAELENDPALTAAFETAFSAELGLTA